MNKTNEQTVLTDQEIYDKFGFLEGLVNEHTYRHIAEKAIEIYKAARLLPAASEATVKESLSVGASEAGAVPCPFPCGWTNLHTLAVQDGAYLAKQDWPEDEEGVSVQRAAMARTVDNLIQVCRAMLAAERAAPPAPVEAGAVPVSIGMVRWRNGEPFVALNKNGRELEAGSILYAEPVDAGARMGRDATISKVVGLCNRIPGSTTWNAAEFMFDELLAAAPSDAPAQQEPLCEDEGCPHHGAPHVCIAPPAPVEAGAVRTIHDLISRFRNATRDDANNGGREYFDAARAIETELRQAVNALAAPSDAPAQHKPLGPASAEDQAIYESIATNYAAPAAQGDERALQAAAEAVERSATVWEGFAMQDAKTCITAYRAALSRQPSAPASAGILRSALVVLERTASEAWRIGERKTDAWDALAAALGTARATLAAKEQP
jgi:hypothetical protein